MIAQPQLIQADHQVIMSADLTFHGIFERHNRRAFRGKGTDEVKV